MVPRETIGPAPSQPAAPPQPRSFLPLPLPRAPEMFQRRGLRGGWGPGSPPLLGTERATQGIFSSRESLKCLAGALSQDRLFSFSNKIGFQSREIELPRSLPQPAFQAPHSGDQGARVFSCRSPRIKATCVYLHIRILRPPATRPGKASGGEEAGSPWVRAGLDAELGVSRSRMAPGTKGI